MGEERFGRFGEAREQANGDDVGVEGRPGQVLARVARSVLSATLGFAGGLPPSA